MNEPGMPETITVAFRTENARKLKPASRLLCKIGAKRSGDVLLLPRSDDMERWQSDSIAHISFHLNGVEQFLDDELWDELVLEYPIATVPPQLALAFADFVEAAAKALELQGSLASNPIDSDDLRTALSIAIDQLRERGFEPGSEELRLSIEAQYG